MGVIIFWEFESVTNVVLYKAPKFHVLPRRASSGCF